MSRSNNQPIRQNGSSRSTTASAPKSEVVPKAKRRIFTARYKQQILQEVDQCAQPGQIGTLLRREGLYSSHLTTWRRQQEAAQLAGLNSGKRGRKARQTEQEQNLACLQRENEQLKQKLAQAELILAAQKKLAQLLEQIAQQESQPCTAR